MKKIQIYLFLIFILSAGSVKTQSIYPEMVSIPGGTFQMGSNDGTNDEKPVHRVTVSSFEMSKYEITHEQFIYFLNDINCSSNGSYKGKELVNMEYNNCALGYNNKFYFNGCDYANSKLCPIITITWYGADAYCKWLSRKTGKTYRLPTEAEWEYAAGGGSSHTKYAGTNSESSLGSYAWYDDNSGDKTHPVGQKSPNKYGLYDMSGNVWEWCSDWYIDYTSDSQTNPTGPSSGYARVSHGGSYYNDAGDCRVTSRFFCSPTNGEDHLGFRVVSH